MLTVTTATSGNEKLVVFMLHGHGMRATDLSPFAGSLKVAGRFHHPQGSHALPDGSSAWWPKTLAAEAYGRPARNFSGLRPLGSEAARRQLAGWLRDPALVPPGSKLVLAGFSQGGMLACDTVLLEGVQVDALAVFSSSPIAIEEWRPKLSQLAGTPVLIAHGTRDAELAFSCGEALRDCFEQAGAEVDWLAFDGGHQLPLPVWRRFRRLLQKVRQQDE